MKVVIFCGGQGMRMRPLLPGGVGMRQTDVAPPKPMVHVGRHPLMWHVMKYYAHWGHKDFILCLGYQGESIKNYFLNYNEWISNDFVMTEGGRNVEMTSSDIEDWRIRFCDTGLHSCVGERLMKVREHLGDDDMFLANYADGLSDLPLPPYQKQFEESGAVAGFVCVRPSQTSHLVDSEPNGMVKEIRTYTEADAWINGGYFIFKKELFDYIQPGEDLVREPFHRLIQEGKLFGFKYDGYWTCIDTFKEKEELDQRYADGDTPWRIWDLHEAGEPSC